MGPCINRKVLLVDDDDVVCDMFRRLLSRVFEVHIAKDGQQAFEILAAEGPFAVVLSDFRMPRISGVELLSQVRSLWPATSRILMTGHLESPETNDSELATILGKPCAYPELIETLTLGVDAYEFRSRKQNLC